MKEHGNGNQQAMIELAIDQSSDTDTAYEKMDFGFKAKEWSQN